MPTNLMPPDAPKEQPAAQAPDFKTYADQYLSTALNKPVTWGTLDAEVANLPVDPVTGKAKTDVGKVRKSVVDSYVNDVLPQHYPREVLAQMQAKARADLDPQVTASSLGGGAATKPDPKTAGYDSLIQLEGKLKDPAQRAENTIALDKASRANGKKIISDLGLSQIDVGARRTLIQQEIDKRRKLAEVVVDKFNAGEVPAEQAQSDIDRIAREVSSLDGALKDTNDASTWSTEAVWAAGGVGKALLSLPEFAGRIVNGTTNWITDKSFAVGFSDDSGAVVGNMASARQWITHKVEDWDIGDPSQVKLDATMRAFDDGGFGGGLNVMANHPEVALRMLATSGVDSVAQFLAGGYAGAGTAALVKGAMRGATSVAEITTLAQGAATARLVGSIGAGTTYAALSGADEEKRHVTDAVNSMGTDKFLSLPEVQKEQAVWGKLQGEALNTYIASKKQAIIDEAYTKTATTTAALLAASGYIGSKYGVEAWLLGRRDALGAAAGASVGSRVAHGVLSGAVGGTHEGLEEVAETGTQHVFYVDALDKDLHDKTPFSNFSGAFAQGFVVGGVMDGYAGSRAVNAPTASANGTTPSNPTAPDDLTTQWTDDQLQTPEVAKRVDAAYTVFGGEASPYSVTGLKNTLRENTDGTTAPAFFTLDKATRERLDRLQQQAGDPTQPAADLQQSRARHMLMLETARVKRTLETRERREAYRTAMDATRTAKDDPNEFVRRGVAEAYNQLALPGVPERNEMVQARADSLREAPTDELRAVDPAQGNLDFAPQGMNYDWLLHGASNPQSQATGTADDQLALPLDAPFSGADPLSQPAQMGLPLGAPYDPSLTPKPYTQEDYGIGNGWQMQLVFDGGVQSRVLEVVDNLQEEQAQQAERAPQAAHADEPTVLPPESNTALALEAGIPVAEHHTSIASQVVGSAGIDVTVDDKGQFFVVLSNETADDTRITPLSVSSAVSNATTMLPNNNPFEQANLAIKGIMTAVGQVGKVKNPAITAAVRYAVLREVLNALPNNYVTHHASGRRRSEKQMRKSATTWAGLHRTMIEERARIYDAPRSTTAYDYVVGNRTTLTPRLKVHREALDDLRGKWFTQQNELEALGTDGIIDALVTAPEKTTSPAAQLRTEPTPDPVQAAVTKVAAVEVAQTISDFDNGDLMPTEVAADVVSTNDVQAQIQEQLQSDLEDAIAAVDMLGGTPEQTRAILREVEAVAEAQAEVLGVPLDTTQLDVAYEHVAQDVTPEAAPAPAQVSVAPVQGGTPPKPRKRRKAAFEPTPEPEAEYVTPPVEEDILVDKTYLNDDRQLDAAIRVSEMRARKQKKIPLWQQRRDAELGLAPPVESAPPEAMPVDNLATATPETSVVTDIIPELVEQAQVQHEALNPTTVTRKGKRKVDVTSKVSNTKGAGGKLRKPAVWASDTELKQRLASYGKTFLDNMLDVAETPASEADAKAMMHAWSKENKPLYDVIAPHAPEDLKTLAKYIDTVNAEVLQFDQERITTAYNGMYNGSVNFTIDLEEHPTVLAHTVIARSTYDKRYDKELYRSPRGLAVTLVHEGLHSITYHANTLLHAIMREEGKKPTALQEGYDPTKSEVFKKAYAKVPELRPMLDFAVEVNRIYYAVYRKLQPLSAGIAVRENGQSMLYGITSADEMLAELSVPEWRELLDSVPYNGGTAAATNKSVMTAIRDALAKLLAMLLPKAKQGSAYSAIVAALDTFYASTVSGKELPIPEVVEAVTNGHEYLEYGDYAPSPTQRPALDFSKGWLEAVMPYLSTAQQSLAKAADAIITQRGGDNAVYMSFDKTDTDHTGGFYVPAWDKAFVRYAGMPTPEAAAKIVLHEKMHQALRDIEALNGLRDAGVAGDAKSAVAKEVATTLDNMHNLLEHTRWAVADRVSKDVAYEGVLYGLRNVAEFRAELSNPAFGRVLAAIDAPHSGSVLGAMLRAVRKLFGLHVPSVHDMALNDLHRLLQITAGGRFSAAAGIVARAHLDDTTEAAAGLARIEKSGYARLTPNNPAALYAAAQRDGFGSPAMQMYANRQVVDAPLSADAMKAQFDKMDGC